MVGKAKNKANSSSNQVKVEVQFGNKSMGFDLSAIQSCFPLFLLPLLSCIKCLKFDIKFEIAKFLTDL